MNRSLRAPERPQIRSLRTSMVKEKDEDLALFLEMRKREKELDDLLLQNTQVLEAPLGAEQGRSSVFDITASTRAPARKKNYSDDFLNSENDKNDFDWLLALPGTHRSPSVEVELPRTVVNQVGTSKARPVALKSRVANTQPEAVGKSNLASRQPNAGSGLNTSSSATGIRRASAASVGPGSTRPSTPTRRPTLSSSPKPSLTTPKTIPSRTSKPTTTTTTSKPARSSTPTSSRSTTLSTTKSTVPTRSSTPTRPRPSIPSSIPQSRSATPTRRPTVTNTSATSVKSNSAAAQPRVSSPNVKPKSWNPLEMPGFSLDAPPNLRTTLPDRPLSASRGRPGATNSSRSSSVEPMGNTGRVRRQSCSPSRGRAPNGVIHGCGSSVPAMSRLHAKANDNISPVLMGTKMVERMINMRKLAPPRQDDKHSPLSNLSGKSSSPDGFGRTISKKSLDMAIRHMDIRRTVPGGLRPLLTNVPASSMYSVRSGHSQSRTVSVSDSPLASSSSNGSSEMSVNNWLYPEGVNEVEDVITISRKSTILSPSSSARGR